MCLVKPSDMSKPTTARTGRYLWRCGTGKALHPMCSTTGCGLLMNGMMSFKSTDHMNVTRICLVPSDLSMLNFPHPKMSRSVFWSVFIHFLRRAWIFIGIIGGMCTSRNTCIWQSLWQLKEENEGSMCELRWLAERKDVQKEYKKDWSGNIDRKKLNLNPDQMAQHALSHGGKFSTEILEWWAP